MTNNKLNQISKNIDLTEISELRTPYSSETLSNITKRKNSTNMELSFDMMSRTFFDSSYAYLLDIMSVDDINEFQILNILHNLFIGIELSLKSTLMSCKEILNKRWMDESSALYAVHNPLSIIKDIQDCIQMDEKFTINDQAWINIRLSLIQNFVEINKKKNLTFESTQYPLNKNIKYLEKVRSSSDIDLKSMKKWIEVLYRCCDDLFLIKDK